MPKLLDGLYDSKKRTKVLRRMRYKPQVRFSTGGMRKRAAMQRALRLPNPAVGAAHRQRSQSRAATEAIVHAAQVTPGMQILDLASGTGEPALTLAMAVRPGGGTSPPRIWCPRWWRPLKSRRSNARLPI